MSQDQATQRLAEVLGQIAKLPTANLEPPQFFANYLQLSIAATSSVGGAIWVLQQDQPPQCYCHVDLDKCNVQDQGQQQMLGEAVLRTAKEGKPLVVPPASAVGEAGSADGKRNESPCPLFFRPLQAAGRVAMVLQLIGREGIDPQDYRTIVALIQQVGEAAETYLAHRRASVLDDDRKSLARLLQYAEGVHKSLDPQKVVYEVANLGRDAIGCTRVTVWVDPVVKRGLRAVSGVDKPDHRAVLMQSIEKLCKHCLQIKQPIMAVRERLVELPEEEELTTLLRGYFNASNLDQILVQPMERDENDYVGVVVAEGFEEAAAVNLGGVIAAVSKHGAVALNNALEMAAVPLVRKWTKVKESSKDKKKRRKWALTGVAVVVILLAVLLTPWSVRIDCVCELTPANVRVVDAPLDGVQIVEVVRPRGLVQAGEVVLRLSDEDLKAEFHSIEAQLAQEKAGLDKAKSLDPLSTEVQVKQLEIARLGKRKAFIQDQVEKCVIKASITGTILTDQLDLREGMTVNVGEAIFQMADLSAWELLLEAPQEEIGWVLRGFEEQENGEGLSVEFFLAAYPEHRLVTSLTEVGQVSQMAEIGDEGNVFKVRAPVEAAALAEISEGLRDGSIGRAKIDTVERRLWYVLLRKVIRFFRVTFF